MNKEITEYARISTHKKQLALIDFQVMLFLEVIEDGEDVYYEVLTKTGSICRYSVLMSCIFLKDVLPEHDYRFMKQIWNNNSMHKAN